MERSRSRLRSLATPVFAKLILFLIAGLLFTVIHYIGNDTLDLFRLAKLFEIDISNVTYGPGDSAALSTILSGMLLINTLPGNINAMSQDRPQLQSASPPIPT